MKERKAMGEEHKNSEEQTTTVRLGHEILRLKRITSRRRQSQAEILRQALIKFELDDRDFAIDVRKAVLHLFEALLPDEQYDPVDDTRQEEAICTLGLLLHSIPAAEGIAEAFTVLFTMNMLAMSTLRFPSGNQEKFAEDQPLGQDE